MTAIETKFLLWGCGILLGILGFIGALAVNALMRMARDVNEIKADLKEYSAKHDGLQRQVDAHERVIEKLQET